MPSNPELKVGELARRTGLTVRTLHHWDQIGLLVPSRHTAAGHRLYTAVDLQRLHRIRSLRLLGFALEEIRGLLEREENSLAGLIRRQITQLDGQIAAAHQLKQRLEKLADRFETAEELSVDELIRSLETMDMYEKYFDAEQRATLAQRRAELGEEAIAAAQDEWPRLIAEVRALVDAGVAPEDPRAAQAAQRWMELVQAFTGGNAAIAQSVQNLYQQEPQYQAQQGLDPSLFAFVRAANAARTGA